MAWAHCPDCSAFLSEKKVSRGSHIQCPGCGTRLEIASVDPFDAVMVVVSVTAPSIGLVGPMDDVGSGRTPRRAR
jgi:hypothetical protein